MRQPDHTPVLAFEMDPILSGKAARILRVSHDTVSRLCETGELRAWRVGSRGRWRIDYASVIEYLDKIRQQLKK